MHLLEREQFLDALGGYADEAAAGAGRFVMVTGEAGIGKTSLIEAFRDRKPDLRWLWGSCDGSFTPQPLGPLHEIAYTVGAPLLDLFGPEVDRRQLFSAFLADLEGCDRPTVVVVEDLHWADEATLDWLMFLARRVARTRALLVVSYRDDELAADSPLRGVLGQVASHRSTSRLALPVLSPDAVRHLAGNDADRVLQLTSGNPFYVRELLDSGAREVSATVSDVVTARINRLSPGARELVEAAAILARPEKASLVAEVAGIDPTGLDESVEQGVLTGEAGLFRFRHELTRLAVEQLIPQYRRTKLHGRALDALQEPRHVVDPARLAHHAEGAGNARATLIYATAAARSAMAMRSHREAVAQYDRALRVAHELPLAELADLEEGFADALALRDDWERSVLHRERAVALRRSLGHTDALARNLRAYTNAMWRMCRGDDADRVAAELIDLTRDAPDSLEKGLSLYYYGAAHEPDPEQAEKLIDEARRIGQDLENNALVARTLLATGYQQLHRGEDGLTTHVQALELAQDAGDDLFTATEYTNVYEIATAQLRFGEFGWAYSEGMEFMADADMPVYTYCLRASHGTALMRQGMLDEAVALTSGLLGETMSPVNRMHMLIPLVESHFRRGDPRAMTHLTELRDLARDNGEAEWQVQVATAIAQGVWLTGDRSMLDEDFRRWVARDEDTDPWFHGDLRTWLMRLGETAPTSREFPLPYSLEHAGLHAEAASWWHDHGCPFEEAMAWYDAGDAESLHKSLELFTSLVAEPAAARARLALRDLGERAVPRGPRAATKANEHGLTSREAEVLALLQEGLTNAAIANRLVISRRTVDHHVSAVLAKLGVASRADLPGVLTESR